MKCYNCGQFLPEDSEFCQYCGKRIEKQTSVKENADVQNVVETIIKIQAEETDKRLQESKKEKKAKISFCKFCGGQIDDRTKKCSGCGKQYFRGIKFNKFLTTVLILSLVIISSIILNIVQSVKINELNEDIEYYTQKSSEQQTKISNLNKEIKEIDNDLEFYQEYAVIVNDNSKKYHLHGCSDLGDYSFRIYNISQAKNLGYSECSKCYNKLTSQNALNTLRKKYGLD